MAASVLQKAYRPFDLALNFTLILYMMLYGIICYHLVSFIFLSMVKFYGLVDLSKTITWKQRIVRLKIPN